MQRWWGSTPAEVAHGGKAVDRLTDEELQAHRAALQEQLNEVSYGYYKVRVLCGNRQARISPWPYMPPYAMAARMSHAWHSGLLLVLLLPFHFHAG